MCTSTPVTATALSNLRLVLLGGQALRRQEADRFRASLGKAEIRYRLAGSETMLMAQFSLNGEQGYAGDSVPVGYPAPDKEILLLDEERHPVCAGEAGEIAVRSRYLATGYGRQPQLTAATFLPDVHGGDARICLTGDMGRFTPNGLLLHLGRKDNMVKIRGYRVPLEELEAALSALENVREAVVVAQDLPSGEKRLVAYVVPAVEPAPSATMLRRALLQRLPAFMAPALFVFLDRPLPLTAAGKVDRQALPPPGKARPALDVPFVAPRLDLVTAPRIPDNDIECLTQAVYYEARNESEEGQAAVAQVVMNRSRHGAYPKSVCAVVYQRNSRTCQFTFTCDGSIGRGRVNLAAWRRAERIAREVHDGRSSIQLPKSSVNYHADYVRPSWGRRLERVRQIGAHIFYGAPLNGANPGANEAASPARPGNGLIWVRNDALDRAYALVSGQAAQPTSAQTAEGGA